MLTVIGGENYMLVALTDVPSGRSSKYIRQLVREWLDERYGSDAQPMYDNMLQLIPTFGAVPDFDRGPDVTCTFNHWLQTAFTLHGE